jgi:hypothetical protein
MLIPENTTVMWIDGESGVAKRTFMGLISSKT